MRIRLLCFQLCGLKYNTHTHTQLTHKHLQNKLQQQPTLTEPQYFSNRKYTHHRWWKETKMLKIKRVSTTTQNPHFNQIECKMQAKTFGSFFRSSSIYLLFLLCVLLLFRCVCIQLIYNNLSMKVFFLLLSICFCSGQQNAHTKIPTKKNVSKIWHRGNISAIKYIFIYFNM